MFPALEFPAEPEDFHVNVLLQFGDVVLPARGRRAVAGHPDHELGPSHKAPPAGTHDGLEGRVGLKSLQVHAHGGPVVSYQVRAQGSGEEERVKTLDSESEGTC